MSLIHASGHPNVKATHSTTIEITTEDFLTPTGDCIIAISADTACSTLPKDIKSALKAGKRLEITISCGGEADKVIGYGHEDLTLTNPVSMVIRKSDYICPRTLCIRADKAAKDLKRSLVEELKKGKPVKVVLSVV